MNHLQKLMRGTPKRADDGPFNLDELVRSFSFEGVGYPLGMLSQTSPGGKTQEIKPNFSSFSTSVLRRNGIVWACVVARMMLFSEAVFQFRPLGSITSGDLYGTQELASLETPWPGANTRKMLNLVDLHVQLDGNAYVYRDGDSLRVARPDWMSIVLGSSKPARPGFEVWDIDTEILGYVYRPNGQSSSADEIRMFLPNQIAHFMPVPDPIFHFRGMSWLQPVVQEIMGDTAMTEHKNMFLKNGATPNMVVTLDNAVRKEEFDAWVEKFDAGHTGALNAYKTIYLAGGADAKVVGADLKQLDFRMVQAHGETRICNAAGIPPIIVGVSEGLDSATYSNYAQARRAWADAQLRPLWATACAELGRITNVPAGSELWYDERRIAFLQEDLKDAASIMQTQAMTLQALITAGWKPASAQMFLETGDLSKLSHTGLYSIQLQPPGAGQAPSASTSSSAPPPALPIVDGKPAASLLCSLCNEPAASNSRCHRCAELSKDLLTEPVVTRIKIAGQLGITEHHAAVALGQTKEPPPRLEVEGPTKDYLTDRNKAVAGRLVSPVGSNGRL